MRILKKLTELSELATSGPWIVKYGNKAYQADHWVESPHGDLGPPEDGGGLGTSSTDNAEFIAAANPETIKALVAVAWAADSSIRSTLLPKACYEPLKEALSKLGELG